jgi:hypothetical protein
MFPLGIRRILVLLAISTGAGCHQSESITDQADPATPTSSPAIDSVDPESTTHAQNADSVATVSGADNGQPKVATEEAGQSPVPTDQPKPIHIEGLTETPGDDNPTALSADDGVVVVAEGVGLDPKRALDHALSQAVRQVVGAYIDAETLIKNDQLVHHKVLSYSRGFVSDYKEIAERKIDGLTRVTISAIVHRTKLAEVLKSVDVPTRQFPGRRLYSTIFSEMKEKADAQALIEKALYGGVPGDLVNAEVIGMPKVIKKTEDEVTLGYNVRLSIAPKRFQALVAGMLPVLEQVATHKGKVTLTGSKAPERTLKTLRTEFSAPAENLFSYIWTEHIEPGESSATRIDKRGTLTELPTTPSAWFADAVAGARYNGFAVLTENENLPDDVSRFGPFVESSDSEAGKQRVENRNDRLGDVVTIVVNVDREPIRGFRTNWRWYEIPNERFFSSSMSTSAQQVIFPTQEEVTTYDLMSYLTNRGKRFFSSGENRDHPRYWKNAGRGLVVDVLFSDDKGNVIKQDSFPTAPLCSALIPNNDIGGAGPPITHPVWILSPFILHTDFGEAEHTALHSTTESFYLGGDAKRNWGYATGITYSRTITVPLKDLRLLNKVKATVEKNFADLKETEE